MRIDEVLSTDRKAWIYKTLKSSVAHRICGGAIDADTADELVSRQYERLMGKSVEAAFPRGIPESNAQWKAFLLKDGNWVALNHLRKQWRHPVKSLDEEVAYNECKSDDDGDTHTLMEEVADDGEGAFRPWIEKDPFFKTPEARCELPLVRKAFACLCQGMTDETHAALEDLFFREMDGDEVAARHGLIKANAVYAKRFRFNAALAKNGRRILEMLEAAA